MRLSLNGKCDPKLACLMVTKKAQDHLKLISDLPKLETYSSYAALEDEGYYVFQ